MIQNLMNGLQDWQMKVKRMKKSGLHKEKMTAAIFLTTVKGSSKLQEMERAQMDKET